jgi:hypothetical protein
VATLTDRGVKHPLDHAMVMCSEWHPRPPTDRGRTPTCCPPGRRRPARAPPVSWRHQRPYE